MTQKISKFRKSQEVSIMRILVLSDSHRDSFSLKEAIDAQPGAKTIFFLGDGLAELDALLPQYPGKTFFSVRGNCDWGSTCLLYTSRCV